MNAAHIALPLLVAWSGLALAERGDFRIVVEAQREAAPEDTALHGYVHVKPGARHSRAVGTVGRAFSESAAEGNTVWGVVTEAINFPAARGNVVGMEAAVVNTAPDNQGELRGIDVVFKNRMDADYDRAVQSVGANRFNDNSAALYVSSQPRSAAGEFSGWQSGLKFGRHSLDRSATVPYAAAIDVSEAEVSASFYLIVWRCGAAKCGLRPTPTGAEIVAGIDR